MALFINPDILQQQLLTNRAIYLSAFDLEASPVDFRKFSTSIGQSWRYKAASVNASIQLEISRNSIVVLGVNYPALMMQRWQQISSGTYC